MAKSRSLFFRDKAVKLSSGSLRRSLLPAEIFNIDNLYLQDDSYSYSERDIPSDVPVTPPFSNIWFEWKFRYEEFGQIARLSELRPTAAFVVSTRTEKEGWLLTVYIFWYETKKWMLDKVRSYEEFRTHQGLTSKEKREMEARATEYLGFYPKVTLLNTVLTYELDADGYLLNTSPVIKTPQTGFPVSNVDVASKKGIELVRNPRLLKKAVEDEDFASLEAYEIRHSASMVLFSLALLNTKNIEMFDSVGDIKPKKKRRRRRKSKGEQFYTLRVRPSKSRSKGDSQPTGANNSFHLARGHFKTYTEENPLFGRHTGTYWWDAHTRGSKAKGTITKDYEVHPAKEETTK